MSKVTIAWNLCVSLLLVLGTDLARLHLFGLHAPLYYLFIIFAMYWLGVINGYRRGKRRQ